MAKTRRQKLLAAGARQRDINKCPQPYKETYPDQASAETEILNALRGARKNRALPIRTYHCECGAWHLTKTPNRQKVTT